MGGPVEPGLMPPALDLAFLSCLRRPMAAGTMPPAVQTQMNNSILARASGRWSSNLARCIFVEGQCDSSRSMGDNHQCIYLLAGGERAPQLVRVS